MYLAASGELQQDQPMIEDGCEIGRDGYEQEFGSLLPIPIGQPIGSCRRVLGLPCRQSTERAGNSVEAGKLVKEA